MPQFILEGEDPNTHRLNMMFEELFARAARLEEKTISSTTANKGNSTQDSLAIGAYTITIDPSTTELVVTKK